MMQTTTQNAHRRPRWRGWPAVVLCVVIAAASHPAWATNGPQVAHLTNGIEVTLYDADLLASRLITIAGTPVIPISDDRYLSVITDINDPAIYNKGDGSFHPFPVDMVLQALEAISQPYAGIRVTVYLLPYPRRNILVSSTSGTEIFLSPHVLEIQPDVGAYIATHEFGHAFQNTRVPVGSDQWARYLQVRNIDDPSVYSETATHADRPKEIFAEDFRALFGGPLATWNGQIENTELPPPLTVPTLDRFMSNLGSVAATSTVAMVAARSYPNPFNPETEIHVTVPQVALERGDRLTVRVYDVTGALVRELYSGVPSRAEMDVRWDGTDSRGQKVASANYFAQIRAGAARTTLKLVMLK